MLFTLMSHRAPQIAGIIRTLVATHALAIPPNLAKVVSVISVKVSADLSYADVYISALEGVEAAREFLSLRTSDFRRELASTLQLHRVPAFRFHVDTEGARANKLEKILDSLR